MEIFLSIVCDNSTCVLNWLILVKYLKQNILEVSMGDFIKTLLLILSKLYKDFIKIVSLLAVLTAIN